MDQLINTFIDLLAASKAWAPDRQVRVKYGGPLPSLPTYDAKTLLGQLECYGGVNSEPALRDEFHAWLKNDVPQVVIKRCMNDGKGYYSYKVNNLLFQTEFLPVLNVDSTAPFNPELFVYYARRIQKLTANWAASQKHWVHLTNDTGKAITAVPLDSVSDFYQFDRLVQRFLPEYFTAIGILLDLNVPNSRTNVHERDCCGIVVASVQINQLLFVV